MSPQASPKYTILVFAISGVGHVNATAGATLPLVKRGHRVIFMLDKPFAGKLAPLGFEEHIYEQDLGQVSSTKQDDAQTSANPADEWANVLLNIGMIGPFSPEHKLRAVIDLLIHSESGKSLILQFNAAVSDAIEQYRPDLLWFDAIYVLPAIYYSGIPWVRNISISPIAECDDADLPPGRSGYPSNAVKDEAWRRFKDLHVNHFKRSKEFNDHLEVMGYQRYPDDVMIPERDALLTVFALPDELLFLQIRAKPWFNLEVFNKNESRETVDLKELLPSEFMNDTLDGKFSGKWVYLSLGSMGSIDLSLMKRILEAISKTNHKYIVSKGPRHAEYGLPRNAWGDRYLPQTKLLSQMDLVITHGGNNTITETFAQGRPMLVLPLFGDQYDNAQRLHETGYGVRLDPYHFTEGEMVDSINRMLANDSLKRAMEAVSSRIQSTNKHEELADKVEMLMAQKDG